ncbi:Ger(x)C family spore germination protein [Bacillus carboniphilus]|uniref:Ger(X)C family spore germination protein n=1 Tax=Bacillus carboniphilus TaxID=86663 RepID=A0ABY9JUW8_9BACI|nr:Ger(x)C family spore germination protein [Bacillus carboniphilus]WLR43206.1 Ger(x)C family spore germination protein [Bacillus carboniphilus]
MLNRMKVIPVVCFVVLMSSCVEPEYISEVGLTTMVGYDLIDEGMIEGSNLTFQFDPAEPNNLKFFSGQSKTSKGIRQELNAQSSYKIVSGQIRVALYGKSLAEKGIFSIVDTLARDSAIGTMMYLSVSEAKAVDIIKRNLQESIETKTKFYELIKQNIESEHILSCTLHEFLQSYYMVGEDPSLPMISLKEDLVSIIGTGLFKKDKLVGFIDLKESFFLKVVKDEFTSGTLELEFPREKLQDILTGKGVTSTNEVFVTIDNIKSTSTIKLIDKKIPSFKVDLNIDARLLEISEELVMGEKGIIALLEKEIAQKIEDKTVDLFEKLKSMESDPIGFGKSYDSQTKNEPLNEEEWRKLYANSEYDINVNLKIFSTGVID